MKIPSNVKIITVGKIPINSNREHVNIDHYDYNHETFDDVIVAAIKKFGKGLRVEVRKDYAHGYRFWFYVDYFVVFFNRDNAIEKMLDEEKKPSQFTTFIKRSLMDLGMSRYFSIEDSYFEKCSRKDPCVYGYHVGRMVRPLARLFKENIEKRKVSTDLAIKFGEGRIENVEINRSDDAEESVSLTVHLKPKVLDDTTVEKIKDMTVKEVSGICIDDHGLALSTYRVERLTGDMPGGLEVLFGEETTDRIYLTFDIVELKTTARCKTFPHSG